jgi:glycosyltransferase involved in cell wall biosynthesis
VTDHGLGEGAFDVARVERSAHDAHPPPMHVLTQSVALSPLGGVEVCTLQDSVALSERGHRLSLAYEREGSLRSSYEAAGVELRGPYQFSLDLHRPIGALTRLVAPARWARAERPDVLWLNRIEHLPWGQAVSRWAGCPLVCHLHGPPVYGRLHLVARGVAHFIAVSDFIRQQYVDGGIEPERITRVYNAIAEQDYPPGNIPERRQARQQLGLPADVPVVLSYGQMSQAKGMVTLIDAWRAVRCTIPDALLVLVDAISEQPDPVVARALATLDPASYRLFPITADVVPFLHASDVVAFPTLLPEAFGRVVLEGMATGRPVVASRIGAVPELLSGQMARFLVEPGSPGELASRLADVLEWRLREPGLGRACAEWVQSRFHFEAHGDQLEGILSSYALRRRW